MFLVSAGDTNEVTEDVLRLLTTAEKTVTDTFARYAEAVNSIYNSSFSGIFDRFKELPARRGEVVTDIMTSHPLYEAYTISDICGKLSWSPTVNEGNYTTCIDTYNEEVEFLNSIILGRYATYRTDFLKLADLVNSCSSDFYCGESGYLQLIQRKQQIEANLKSILQYIKIWYKSRETSLRDCMTFIFYSIRLQAITRLEAQEYCSYMFLQK